MDTAIRCFSRAAAAPLSSDSSAIAGSVPAISGTYVVTVVDATNFTIPVDVTTAGVAGTVTCVPAGYVLPADFDPATNAAFWQSV